jgi:hypothetical protein
MKNQLLFTVGLALTSYGGYGQAPYILAGQTAGTSSVILVPIVSLSGQGIFSMAGGGTRQQEPLDVDNDGVVDLVISASGYSQPRQTSHAAFVQVRDSNVELYSYPPTGGFGYTCFGLASGDTLQSVMRKRNANGLLGTWSSASQINPISGATIHNPLAFSSIISASNGQVPPQGDWLDLRVHYAGFRLRSSSTAPWRYGWIRLQNSSNANPVTISIQAYAAATPTLSRQSARTVGWQVYPTSVVDQLTLEPPSSTERGQVIVQDLCGRSVLQATLSGRRQRLNLAGLATGCYVVRFDTPRGQYTQRITKQ